jgi:hypothetical protein
MVRDLFLKFLKARNADLEKKHINRETLASPTSIMRPLSFLAVLLLSVPTNAASVVQPAPNAGTVFAVYPGWDMDNGALQTILNGTELACLQSCSSSGFRPKLLVPCR